MNILVIAPHPDDDVIGCGGSIAKHVKEGHTVHILYVTSGDAGSLSIPKSQLALLREKEAQEGAASLGVSQCIFLRIPDGQVEYTNDALVAITTHIRVIRPQLAYVPHKHDGHRDHQKTYELFIEAAKRAGSGAYPEAKGSPWRIGTVLTYEVWTPIQNVQYVEDISSYIEQKMAAIGKHVSQLSQVRYDEAAKSLNRYRGVTTQRGMYCECFGITSLSSLT